MPSKSGGNEHPLWRMHHPYDRTLKRIAERVPAELLGWLVEVSGLPPMRLVQEGLSKELVRSEQEVDLLMLVETEGEQELLHWEFQLEKEKGMGARMADYVLQLFGREKGRWPVHPVVLWLRQEQDLPAPPLWWAPAGEPTCGVSTTRCGSGR